ncbi:MAG: LacI family DNA-binding transcriptional regulator [Ardenticatenaceae bacterium]|nr:LacI family DNA-binding transcriptional regulator [Ardenticatenaceae bacterium]MCB9443100.1 LacI family DNA-binding transcriptional regulator [Ardenticatenaceae bacterium]
MKSPKGSVTILDVAKEAGVSVSTVSRVLNDKDDVAPETYEKVKAVIGEMGYTSSLAARSMRSRKKHLIGLVVPDIGFPYSIEVMKGINRAIAESNYDLLLYTTGDVKKNAAALHEQHYVSLLNKSITDGVLVVASAAAEFRTDAPIVAVDPHMPNPNYPAIHATNHQGALDAMAYLISLGHRRIGFISGRPELESAKRRLKGYEDALQQAGIELDPSLIKTGDFTSVSGCDCAKELLALPQPPTAIFAANDQTAIGVYQAADELGLRIPEDLSVVGFDNISEARFMGLTTVDQFLAEMGYIATQMLITLIQNRPLEEYIYKMPTQLVIRDSARALSA